MRVLVFPVEREHHDAFREAEQARLRRERGALLFRFDHAAKPQVCLDFQSVIDFADSPVSPTGAAIRAAILHERTELIVFDAANSNSRSEMLIVPLTPPLRLVIFGGGHVGQAVAWQASLLGFDITVIDDRADFTVPERFPPGIATICAPMDEQAGCITMDENTFVAIVTRGHPQDAAVLARCLRRPSAYLGMMGSRRKVELVRREFIESGRATADEFDRVYAPIGLDLGAETVPEIAASIVAQLVAVRRKLGCVGDFCEHSRVTPTFDSVSRANLETGDTPPRESGVVR